MVFAYIFMILCQIFALYWHSNEIREESMAISIAIYSSNFLDFTIPMKRKLILIILRSQKPLEIKVANWAPMTLEMFQTLLNTAYSYYNLVRSVNKKI
jgi:odorant receptor